MKMVPEARAMIGKENMIRTEERSRNKSESQGRHRSEHRSKSGPPKSRSRSRSKSQVYMARDIKTGEIVDLKKIRIDNEKEGFPITAIREIKIMKKLQHENVIRLKEIVTSTGPEADEQAKPDGDNKYKGNIYMVFECMDHDLTGLADRPGLRFIIPQIKCYMKQLLTGLHYSLYLHPVSMNSILERYERYSSAERHLIGPGDEVTQLSSYKPC